MFTLALFSALALSPLGVSKAQTWSDARQDPALWQIVAIDRTGEAAFPYGREDIAGDGLGSFSAAEAAADLRTVYASSAAMSLWLRAYFAGSAAPSANLRAFFFIDADARSNTGGSAQGMELDEALAADPSSGGYERAVVVRGNGMLQGVFEWDENTSAWVEIKNAAAPEVSSEVGVSRDPLAIGGAQHGYVQLELAHALSNLTASCGGSLFVRVLDQGPAMRTFADEPQEKISCRAREDDHGVPVVLRPAGCASDAECPAGGRCRDGACLFTFECDGAADCPSGYSCMQNRCVRVVSGSCDSAADCEGLVCDSARCVACSDSGGRACESGLSCAPDGSCVNPEDLGGSGGPSGATPPGKVRGGAFSCALSSVRASSSSLGLIGLGLIWLRKRRRQRMRRERSRSPL